MEYSNANRFRLCLDERGYVNVDFTGVNSLTWQEVQNLEYNIGKALSRLYVQLSENGISPRPPILV